tara:strand:+ start:590 stop:1177 length:588 start_codon:yes stop_codon:yes gene_type:complete
MYEKEIINGSICIFVLILIIFGNYLGELVPCRVQKNMSKNMYLKHFLGYLTLLFFGTLTYFKESRVNAIYTSFIIYAVFIFISKTYYKFFMLIVVFAGLVYFLDILKSELLENEVKTEMVKTMLHYIPQIQMILVICSIVFGLLGFTIYLGNKKHEYGNRFNYIYFLLGKPKCRDNPHPQTTLYEDLVKAFARTY